ncbi:MAG TPA: FkbM family methyltransferase [Terracidiphilus sp.]|nr:FkbM family methyltransferase [Terracidiphilus sp.]
MRGYGLEFTEKSVIVRKGSREVAISKAHYIQTPTVMDIYDALFDALESESRNGRTILDFSEPTLHRYKKSGVGFLFPSLPEEDQMDAYTSAYVPCPGDVAWDVGAHAGASTYFLAQMVGPNGKVYAFEPDEMNWEFLNRNIELHKLDNVIPVKKALAGFSGSAGFKMDGTMLAGLTEFQMYEDPEHSKSVVTLTLADACAELGKAPNFVKMDIEGAEVSVIEASCDFLKSHPIHFAIESFHRIEGELTYLALERLFSECGYTVQSSDRFGQMFTWAGPSHQGALPEG